jgi:hypothetical protein
MDKVQLPCFVSVTPISDIRRTAGKNINNKVIDAYAEKQQF